MSFRRITGAYVYPMEGPGLGIELLPAVFEHPNLTMRHSTLRALSKVRAFGADDGMDEAGNGCRSHAHVEIISFHI